MACTNPFETYFAYFEQVWLPANPGGSFGAFLDELTILPLASGLCCNDNCQDTPYILVGGATSFLVDYDTNIGLDLKKCCTNTYYTTVNFINFLNEVYQGDPDKVKNALNYKTCCSTSVFNTCVKELNDHLNDPLFKQWISGSLLPSAFEFTSGILETNTVGGNIGFCLLKDALLQRSPVIASEYIYVIFNKGLVLKCTSQGIAITSVETYNANYPLP